MSKLRSYRDLVAWQKAIELTDVVYDYAGAFPKYEQFALSQQLRRAVVSIPSNIAEGSVRGTKEFMYFINIARGSLAEVETQLFIAQRRGYIAEKDLIPTFQNASELSRILMGLLKSLKSPTTA